LNFLVYLYVHVRKDEHPKKRLITLLKTRVFFENETRDFLKKSFIKSHKLGYLRKFLYVCGTFFSQSSFN